MRLYLIVVATITSFIGMVLMVTKRWKEASLVWNFTAVLLWIIVTTRQYEICKKMEKMTNRS